MPASEDASKHLRVAVVAPPWFTIPPDGYGGIEAMVHWLVEGLVARGHQVTLIGAGDCRTSAVRFLQTYEEPPVALMGTPFPEIVHALQADEHLQELDVDVVHDHSMGGPLTARARRIPTVLTAHGPVTGELGECYRLLSRHHPMVAISEAQRAMGPHLPWAGTVYNAIPVDEYPFETEKDDFVLFLGRISPEKAPDLAIKAARAAGRRIVVAAKCNEPAEHAYFEQRVRPLLGPDAEWYGHATTEEKKKLLARASALVFPIQWDEPFGIVMVEAMACGTPVVALRAGSVPELVVDGLTGYICDRRGRAARGHPAGRRPRRQGLPPARVRLLRRAGHGRRLRAGLPPRDRPGGHRGRLNGGHRRPSAGRITAPRLSILPSRMAAVSSPIRRPLRRHPCTRQTRRGASASPWRCSSTYQGRWTWLSASSRVTVAASPSSGRALAASSGSSHGSTYLTVSPARTPAASTPTTAAICALIAAWRSSLKRSNPRSPTWRFGLRQRSIHGGTIGSSAGSSSSPWNRVPWPGGRRAHGGRRRARLRRTIHT